MIAAPPSVNAIKFTVPNLLNAITSTFPSPPNAFSCIFVNTQYVCAIAL